MMLVLLILSLLLGLSCPFHLEEEAYESESEHYRCDRSIDVAIIGAGPSGTYAAYKLRNSDQSIEVFEYSDKIGGRLLTPPLESHPELSEELTGMRFATDKHYRVKSLAEALNLTKFDIDASFNVPTQFKFIFRGKQLNLDEIRYGNVPYNLSAEEKANQADILNYYFSKLTGISASSVDKDKLYKLKVKDGRSLYQIGIQEALEMVATSEGKEFVKALGIVDSYFDKEASAANFFYPYLEYNLTNDTLFTLDGGLSSLPRKLTKAFLSASKNNKLTCNRNLKAIRKMKSGMYKLGFLTTSTESGITYENKTGEHVCAKKVILAIPHFALSLVDWEPLTYPTIKEAIHAVKPTKSNEVYFVFPKTAWAKEESYNVSYVPKSEGPVGQICTWKVSKPSGDYAIAAMFADASKTEFQSFLNSEEKPVPGSEPGAYKVSYSLKKELLGHLSSVLDVDEKKIPEPVVATSRFWEEYPYGGGWTFWKTGYSLEDVKGKLQRPSMTDDVFVVGSDHFFAEDNQWAEAALKNVDELFGTYF